MENLIGKKIKELRLEKKMTQSELAKKASISAVSIQKYELGERSPKIETIKAIANALEVPPDNLIEDCDTGELLQFHKEAIDKTLATLTKLQGITKALSENKKYIHQLKDFYMKQYQLTHPSLAPMDEINDKIFNIGLENFKKILPYDDLLKLNKMLDCLISLDAQLNDDAPLGINMEQIKEFLKGLKEGE